MPHFFNIAIKPPKISYIFYITWTWPGWPKHVVMNNKYRQ